MNSFCAAEAFREISDVDSDAVEGSMLCSMSCFCFSNIDSLTSDTIKTEYSLLLKRNKEQLKKDARELNVKVNCRVNGASLDASKEVIVARLFKKKIVQLYPSLVPGPELPDDGNTTTNKFLLNDTFRLIIFFFSDELSELAMRSEEAALHAELDAGLLGHNSPFWRMVEARFNRGLPLEGVDWMTFGDMIHHLHPLFHQNDTSEDPSIHGQFSVCLERFIERI